MVCVCNTACQLWTERCILLFLSTCFLSCCCANPLLADLQLHAVCTSHQGPHLIIYCTYMWSWKGERKNSNSQYFLAKAGTVILQQKYLVLWLWFRQFKFLLRCSKNSSVFLYTFFLKGQSNKIFDNQFFHQSNPLGPLSNGLKYFWH